MSETKTLTIGNYQVLYDNEDHEMVSKYKWRVISHGARATPYATTDIHQEGKKNTIMKMHRLILNAPKGTIVDHINRNPLDNRRSNLRFANRSMNNRNTVDRIRKNGLPRNIFKNGNNYRAEIRVQGIMFSGTFNTLEETVAYCEGAKEHADVLAICIEALEKIAEAKEFTLRCHYCEAQEVAQQALAKLSANDKVAEIEGE